MFLVYNNYIVYELVLYIRRGERYDVFFVLIFICFKMDGFFLYIINNVCVGGVFNRISIYYCKVVFFLKVGE